MTGDYAISITSHTCEWTEETPFGDAQLPAASLLYSWHSHCATAVVWEQSDYSPLVSVLSSSSQLTGTGAHD